MPTKVEEAVTNISQIVTKKNNRNFIFLIISIIAILAINSLLPIIEGGAHYTEAPEDYTYEEYKTLNKNYSLTWKSKKEITKYKEEYKKEHPEMPAEEFVLLEPPGEMTVQVYTKFFFQHPYWWLATLLHVISVLLVYYSVFNYIVGVRKDNDVRIHELEAEVNTQAASSVDPITFEPWNDAFNLERKRKQHITNIKHKIERLERWTPYKYKKNQDGKYNKQHYKYYIKKVKLEEQISDEYVDKYIRTLRVKHFKYIYSTFVTSGYNGEGKTVDAYSLIVSNTKKISNDGLRKTISSFLLTTIFAIVITFTITSSIDSPWYTILMNVLVRIVPLLIQIPMAFDYCESFLEDQIITNLMHRRSLILLYLASMNTPQIEEAKVDAVEENTGSGQ